jgi:hypothetical protein
MEQQGLRCTNEYLETYVISVISGIPIHQHFSHLYQGFSSDNDLSQPLFTSFSYLVLSGNWLSGWFFS